ncbi:hypothetical protein [Antrihabitans sp. YC2-6]|uniref:hypothetical protein n=1 Tax=Antrihabitans sp. YC2-6 TaxID=2799498 RepID=UPI0018F5CD47|nr:hypothetical protein [Antrihabitans sp. YC2-6]MBJ8343925.1 hypothetical protein [Antrihabitans sp. YC2-6]
MDEDEAIQEFANFVMGSADEISGLGADVERLLHAIDQAKSTCEDLIRYTRFSNDAEDYEVVERGRSVDRSVAAAVASMRSDIINAGSTANDLSRVLKFYNH